MVLVVHSQSGAAGQLGAGGGLAHMSRRWLPLLRSVHRVSAVDRGQWLSWPALIVACMPRLANLGTAP
jgi:hypothetical protein